ncbi:hypothetical protein C7M84_005744 [Penaeus vannamei]|uniref:Ion transport domain-containing protein n=1 Tax=Penaeus vannamei TaxID=6689 RepID=A0A3R7M9H2_PENVA|nr:hypothetical protein C7M84_005744 [Penaeus vannamei]
MGRFFCSCSSWRLWLPSWSWCEDEFCRVNKKPDELTTAVNSTSSVQEANATSLRPLDVGEANATSPRPPDVAEGVDSWDSSQSHFCHAVLCISLIFQIVLEANYIRKLRCQYVNITSLVSFMCIILCVVLLLPTSVCSLQHGIKSVPIWQCGIIALVLASFRLISTINRLPAFSVFTSITQSFIMSYLKGVMYVLAIIFLFALIFHLLLSNLLSFVTLPQALVKMVVWMLGDLGYDDTFINNTLNYPYLVNCLFLVFLFTIGVFLVTLLKAPSTDINKIKFYRMARQAQMYFTIDISFPSFKRSHAIGKFCDKEHRVLDRLQARENIEA